MNREEKTENNENKSTSQYLEVFEEIWYKHYSKKYWEMDSLKK